jgi:hypothetical protein
VLRFSLAVVKDEILNVEIIIVKKFPIMKVRTTQEKVLTNKE